MKIRINFLAHIIGVILSIALISIIALGVWFYNTQEHLMYKKAEEDLTAIAKLKADQISAWRNDQLMDAEYMLQHPFLIENISRILLDGKKENARDLIIRFRTLALQHDYSNIMLVKSDGKIVISLFDGVHKQIWYMSAITLAFKEKKPIISDLHTDMNEKSPHISVVAPIYLNNDLSSKPIGALILIDEASNFLYPLIQTWPTQSKSAETLIIRHEGDHVLFLNELRHQTKSALNLRIPLDRDDVPAVMAIKGKRGFVLGKDYRGVDVAAVIMPIPDSPWIMISKIDADEAFAAWRFRSVLILVLLLGLVSLVVASILVVRQSERRYHYKQLYRSESELRANIERHSVILKAIGDAVIATDTNGKIEMINPTAESLTGWDMKDAKGKPLGEIFKIINEDTRKKVEDPVVKVLKKGVVVGLANHTLLITKDGTEKPIADSGAPILDENGVITGVVLVFRDQTLERAALNALKESEERYRSTLDFMLEGCQIIGFDWKYLYINKTICKHAHKTAEELLGHTMMEVYPGIEQTNMFSVLQHCMEKRVPEHIENEFFYEDGTSSYFDLSIEPIPEGLFILSIDRTERKKVKDELEEKQKQLSTLMSNLPGMAYRCINHKDWKMIFVSEGALDLTGYTSAELLSDEYPQYGDLIHADDQKPVWKTVQQALKKKQSFVLEYRIVDKGGNLRWLREQGRKTGTDKKGNSILDGFIVDITERKSTEEALQKSTERVRLFGDIIENSEQPLSIGYPDGSLGICNRAFSDLTGYSIEEIQSIDWNVVLTPPEWRQIENDNLAILEKTGEPVRYEKEYIRKDGSRVPVELLVHITRDEHKNTLFYYAFVSDMTERKRAEEHERHLNTVLRSIRDVNQIIVREKQRGSLIQAACDNLVRTRGFQGAWIILTDRLPVSIEGAQAGFDQNSLDYLMNTIKEGDYPDCCIIKEKSDQKVFITENPATKCIECPIASSFEGNTGMTVALSHNGSDYGYLVVSLPSKFAADEEEAALLEETAGDIAFALNSIEAQAERERSEQTLTAIFQSARDGILLADINTDRYTVCNDAICDMLGYTTHEMKKITLSEIYNDLDPEKVKMHLEKQTRGEIAMAQDIKIKRKNGTVFLADITYASFKLDEHNHVLGIFRDTTKRKQEEEEREQLQEQIRQSQKMESVGRLAGGVAHDYNNMLGVIIGHVELAMEKIDKTNPLYNSLKEIQAAANRSAAITRQLLAFARKQTISPKVLDLNSTVESMLKMLRRLIGEDIELLWKPDRRHCHVKMDPSQLDQILANLCVNARDAITGIGKVTIETGIVSFDESYCELHTDFIPGDFILLAVSDNGSGMDKETLANIFEPFFTTKSTTYGTGLGLSTVYGIIKQNDGFINVYSELENGTTFRIYLPQHTGKTEKIKEITSEQIPISRGETVLLVEDEPSIIKIGQTMLEKLGYNVLTADTPNDAIKLAIKFKDKIDIIITDVVMPEMNGRELSEKIKDIHPKIKTLFMSGYTANVIAHRGVLDKDINFIQKPFSLRELGIKVRDELD